jgi:hypothetical protein
MWISVLKHTLKLSMRGALGITGRSNRSPGQTERSSQLLKHTRCFYGLLTAYCPGDGLLTSSWRSSSPDQNRVCRNADEAQRLLTQWETEGRVESFERKPAEGSGRPTTAYRLAPLGRR